MGNEKQDEKKVIEAESTDIELFEGGGGEKPIIKGGLESIQGTSLQNLKTMAGEIDERIGYVKQIQTALLKMAYPGDWVVFENKDDAGKVFGKAELSWKGALRILRNFGVRATSPRITKIKEEHSDYYYFICEGEVDIMNSTFTIQAKASSKQSFWKTKFGNAVPIKDISEADIRIAVYHEWLKAIPKIALGFSGMPVDELEKMGVPLTYAKKVTFESKRPPADKPAAKKEAAGTTKPPADKNGGTDNPFVFDCEGEGCHEQVNEKIQKFSKSRYGRVLCYACQKKENEK